MQAAHDGSLKAVRKLLRESEGARDELGEFRSPVVNTIDTNADSALIHAAGQGSVLLVQKALASGRNMEDALAEA